MERFTNGQGMRMLPIEPGEFMMGGGEIVRDHHALPLHKVTLTEGFYMAEQPVTVGQYEAFLRATGREDAHGEWRGYVIGVSHEAAQAYALWLSGLYNRSYHLPTEAEWEYVAKHPGRFAVDRMGDMHLREWCFDWYAPYTDLAETDPAGPENGLFRCVRGGYLDNPRRYNAYPREPYYRAALPPGYCHFSADTNNDFGRHNVGFRVVMGKQPRPSRAQRPFYASVAVWQETEAFAAFAPPADTPYFRKRYLFPVPPDNCTARESRLAGFAPGFRHHHHSPGFTAAANGDLLFSAYSTYHEYDAEAGLVACRFRVGEDEWCLPDVFIDTVGVNDHGPMLHTGRDGRLYHIWGWPQLDRAYPFQYTVSDDNGETWSDVRFPLFRDKAEYVDPQPINSCVEASDGTFYVASDAAAHVSLDETGKQLGGASSVLWRSRDGLQTWENPKARTAGRHTTAVELKDGSILALGGKNTNIDGYMPAAITTDGGDSYRVVKTPFPAENSGQRPSILRLASGALVVCGDYQTKKNLKPADMQEKAGSYAAFSDDEGATWTFRQLWGAQARKKGTGEFGGASTLGYSVMKQSPDGLIHIVCTNVQPLLHLCFNEAWLRAPESPEPDEATLMRSTATRLVTERKEYTERYLDGKVKCRYHGGIADDGRFLLDGVECFYYPAGQMMWEAEYRLGKRCGVFTYYDPDGNPIRRHHYPEQPGDIPTECVETFWPRSDSLRTRGNFTNRKACGEAVYYSRGGEVLDRAVFVDGKIDEGFDTLEP